MKKRKTIENYLLEREIGRGNFGVVYFAVKLDRQKDEPKEYAVKKISKKVINSNVYLDKLLNTEVVIMKSIRHPNVMRLFDYYVTANNYYLVMNYCNQKVL
jgi:serine/threonine protein kinase